MASNVKVLHFFISPYVFDIFDTCVNEILHFLVVDYYALLSLGDGWSFYENL